MNARSIRRAAERKSLKAARKEQPLQPVTSAALPPDPETKAASAAQFAANQANAQFSCGPTSPEGKAISSRNHTSHGLTVQIPTAGYTVGYKVLPNESQSQYDAALAMYLKEWNPATATEFDLVERMATHAWLRHRAQRLQDAIAAQDLSDTRSQKQFLIYGRYYTTHLRSYNKAFADILRLKRFQMTQKKDEAMLNRRAQDMDIRFESQKRKAEEHAAKMESIRLKQEAHKQRNQRANAASTRPETTSAPAQAAVAHSA